MGKEQEINRLQALCSRREMCSAQVRKKLEAAVSAGRLGAEQVESVLEELIRERFVDDERFAGAFVRDKARLSGWGKTKIAFQLRRLALPEGLINRSLAGNYPAEEVQIEVLKRLVERKMASLRKEEDVRKRREKVIRFALGRGFAWEDILKIL